MKDDVAGVAPCDLGGGLDELGPGSPQGSGDPCMDLEIEEAWAPLQDRPGGTIGELVDGECQGERRRCRRWVL